MCSRYPMPSLRVNSLLSMRVHFKRWQLRVTM
jgi:hypothetical protein